MPQHAALCLPAQKKKYFVLNIKKMPDAVFADTKDSSLYVLIYIKFQW